MNENSLQCDEYGLLISCLVDGELTDSEREGLSDHLSGCGECRERLDTFRRLAESELPESELPADDFKDRVCRAVKAELAIVHRKPAKFVNGRRQPSRGVMLAISTVGSLAAAVLFVTFWLNAPSERVLDAAPLADSLTSLEAINEQSESNQRLMLRTCKLDLRSVQLELNSLDLEKEKIREYDRRIAELANRIRQLESGR